MICVLFIQWWFVFIHSETTENLSVRYGRFPRRRREGERCLCGNMIYIKEYY
jgi:hypothetical protein